MKTLVHVGLGKSGSTALQRNVFSLFQGNVFTCDERLPLSLSWIYDLNAEADKRFYDSGSISFSKRIANIVRFRPAFIGKEGKPTLISCEGLIGCSFSPRINSYSNAKTIKQQLGDCHILIVLRPQHEYVRSLYFQLKNDRRIPSNITFQQFFNRDGMVCPSDLLWTPVIGDFVDVFGPSNVTVVEFSELILPGGLRCLRKALPCYFKGSFAELDDLPMARKTQGGFDVRLPELAPAWISDYENLKRLISSENISNLGNWSLETTCELRSKKFSSKSPYDHDANP